MIRYLEDFAPGQEFIQAQPSEAAMLNAPTHGERSAQFPDADAIRIWKAKDGTSVLVRPIERGDFERERRFVDGLSPRAGYQRLMSPRKPSEAELRRWTDIDPTREGALVAIASSDGWPRNSSCITVASAASRSSRPSPNSSTEVGPGSDGAHLS